MNGAKLVSGECCCLAANRIVHVDAIILSSRNRRRNRLHITVSYLLQASLSMLDARESTKNCEVSPKSASPTLRVFKCNAVEVPDGAS